MDKLLFNRINSHHMTNVLVMCLLQGGFTMNDKLAFTLCCWALVALGFIALYLGLSITSLEAFVMAVVLFIVRCFIWRA